MQHPQTTEHESLISVNDGAVRGTIAVGLIMIALVHVIDGIGKWTDGPRYEFWMYMMLVLSAVALAGALLFTRHKLVMPAVVGLVTMAIIAFVLSRTTGLPSATGDIGNWTETIGVVNLFVEVITLAIVVPAALLQHSAAPGRVARRTVGESAPAGAR